jgi:hypothetical protein
MVASAGSDQTAKVTTTKFYFNASTGDLTVGGDINTLSDQRLKYDIENITNSLDKLLKLKGVTYKMGDDPHPHIGLIAQDTMMVVPEVVNAGEFLSISYGNLVALVIEAVKELHTQVEQLKFHIQNNHK